jgi:hypothetical protein
MLVPPWLWVDGSAAGFAAGGRSCSVAVRPTGMHAASSRAGSAGHPARQKSLAGARGDALPRSVGLWYAGTYLSSIAGSRARH